MCVSGVGGYLDGKRAICDRVQLLTLAKACNRFLMCAVLLVSLRFRNRSSSARRGEDEKVGGTVTRLGGGGGCMARLSSAPPPLTARGALMRKTLAGESLQKGKDNKEV